MRRLLFALAMVAALVSQTGGKARAACAVPESQGAFDFESITVSSASIGFTAAKIAPTGGAVAFSAYCVLLSNPINFRADGGAPTAAAAGGLPVVANAVVEVCGNKNVENFRAIRTGASDGILNCQYFR